MRLFASTTARARTTPVLLGLALLLASAPSARAQASEFSCRPMTIGVPKPGGGGGDDPTYAVQEEMEMHSGFPLAQVMLVNQPDELFPMPGGPMALDNWEYVDLVHGNYFMPGSSIYDLALDHPGLIRPGELDYTWLSAGHEPPAGDEDGGEGGKDEPGGGTMWLQSGGNAAPAEITAFDGTSFEMNAQTPPGDATVKDFHGVNLATGQLEVKLPTGIGFKGAHNDFELEVLIRSTVMRNGNLGPFATLNVDDYLLIELDVPLDGLCSNPPFSPEDWHNLQLINSAPSISWFKDGDVKTWINTGKPKPDGSPGEPGIGGLPGANQNSCWFTMPDGTKVPVPQEMSGGNGDNLPVHKTLHDPNVIDAYGTKKLDAIKYFSRFVAPAGVQEVLRWDCDGVVIWDVHGNKYVYGPFYKSRDGQICVNRNDLPHGAAGAPPGMEENQPMARVQLMARLMYRESKEGLRTHVLYNQWGQLKGYRDELGREVFFEYGPFGQGAGVANRIVAAVDQFGRRCEFEYSQGALSEIRLPQVQTGAPGQPILDRVIKVGMDLEILPPRANQVKPTIDGNVVNMLMKGLTVGRPLDAPGAPSFTAEFESFPDLPGPTSLVQSVRLATTRNPSWMSGWTVDGTTEYVYSADFNDKCPADPAGKSVMEIKPNGQAIRHWFDEFGNDTKRETWDDIGTLLTETFEFHAHVNMMTSETDASGLTKTHYYQLDEDDGVWYDADIMHKKDELVETVYGTGGGGSLVTVREWFHYLLVEKERLPGTPASEWDTDRIYNIKGALLTETRRDVQTGLSVPGPSTSITYYNTWAQPVMSFDPLGRKTTFEYHPINDPDGDGNPNWGITNWYAPTMPGSYLWKEIVDPDGFNGANPLALLTELFYDGRGNEVKSIDPRGIPTYTELNEMDQGWLVATGHWDPASGYAPLAGADGATKTWLTFDADGNAVHSDEWNDNPETAVHAPYIRTSFEYDGLDRLVSVAKMLVEPGSPVVEWARTFWLWSDRDQIVRQIGTDGNSISAEYDLRGLMKERREHVDTYATDALGDPLGAHAALTPQAGDRVYTFTYAADEQMITAQDAEGATETLHYDGLRRRVGRTDPALTLLTRELDGKGQVLSEQITAADQTLLKRTEYSYDEAQRLHAKREKWFDETGASLTDGWVDASFRYDHADQLIGELDDDGRETSFAFDGAGRQTKVLHPIGLNATGQRDEDTSEYDSVGNVTTLALREFAPNGSFSVTSVEYEYDDLSRERVVRRGVGGATPDVWESWYDSLGQVVRSLTPRQPGRIGTTFRIDTLGRTLETWEGWNETFSGPADPAAGGGDGFVVTRKEWDLAGLLRAEVDDVAPDHRTEYDYDTLHRLTRITHPDGTYDVSTYRSDNEIDLLQAFDATDALLFEVDSHYDIAKRKWLEEIRDFSGLYRGLKAKAFHHDPLGRIKESYAQSVHPLNPANQFLVHSTFEHDSLGNVRREEKTVEEHPGGPSDDWTVRVIHSLDREWDAYANATLLSSSHGTDVAGFDVERGYDARQRLTDVRELRTDSSPAIAATYGWRGAGGRRYSIQHFNGVTTEYKDYDARARVGTIETRAPGGAVVAGRQYEYAPSSVRTLERKLAESGDDHGFVHDGFDQLTEFRQGSWDPSQSQFAGTPALERLTFDGAGSIALHESGPEGGTLASFAPTTDTTNHYSAFGSTAVARDVRGFTTQIGGTYLAYDVFGHVVGTATGGTITFEVRDAADRRVLRRVGADDTFFVWAADELLQEIDVATQAVDREYVHGPGQDELVGQRIGGQPYGFHVGTMSTPYAATDAVGAVVERYDVDPYGNMTATGGGGSPGWLDNRIGLAGQWYDADTDLYYMRARHYSPELKRFTSTDPLGTWGDATNRGNRYGYVGNNWTLLDDPTGMGFWSWVSEKASSVASAVSSAVSSVASTVRDVAAGAIDGAASAVTFGLYEGTVAGNLMGADTSSTAYAVGNVVGEVAGGIAMGAATGGCGTLARAANLGMRAIDAYQTAEGVAQAGQAALNGEWDKVATAGLQAVGGRLAGKALPTNGCFGEGTLVQTPDGLVPIEALTVGDRVSTTDNLFPPEDAGEEARLLAEPGAWAVASLAIQPDPTNNYTRIEVELLRPRAALASAGMAETGTTRITLPEMEFEGAVEVLDVRSAPRPTPGEGHVVLMTTRSFVSRVWHVGLSGQDAPLVVTGNHPVFTERAREFVRADAMRAGDVLRAEEGAPTITSMVPRDGVHVVRNLGVADSHQYLVTPAGALVHNARCGPGGGSKPKGPGIANRGGRFGDLNAQKLNGEVGHHVPQNAHNRTQGLSRNDGPAVGMTKEDHAKTRTFAGRGNKSMREDGKAGLNSRDRLAKDIKDLRGNFGTKYNKGSLEATKYAKTLDEFKKK